MAHRPGGKKGGAGDKRSDYWEAIRKEDGAFDTDCLGVAIAALLALPHAFCINADAIRCIYVLQTNPIFTFYLVAVKVLRWCVLYSGLEVGTMRNDDTDLTGIMTAAINGKDKALLVILDGLRSKRELKEAIDIRIDEEKGMTSLMAAAAKGNVDCVSHLMYYGASLTAKSAEGMTARDYAVKAKKTEVVEAIDDELGVGADAGAAEAEVDADGLTSTQRSKLKKKAMQEAAAALLASVAHTGEEGGAAGGAGGPSVSRAATGGSALSAGGASVGSAGGAAAAGGVDAYGLPPLPTPAPAPVWDELKTAIAEKRRELTVTRAAPAAALGEEGSASPAGAAAGGAGAPSAAAADDSAASAAPSGASTPAADGSSSSSALIDPALWHATQLNRLELHIAGLGPLPPSIGYLHGLTTLVLSKSGISALPASMAALKDLKFLDVSHNALSDLSPISGLTKLELLDARSNAIADVAPLAPLTGLTALFLDDNAIADVSALNYGSLARLGTLSLSHNASLTALPEDIGKLPLLAVLNVASCGLTALPAGLAGLPEKKIREMILMPNPYADKKVLKILGSDRPEKIVSELFKHLDGGKGGKGGKKR